MMSKMETILLLIYNICMRKLVKSIFILYMLSAFCLPSFAVISNEKKKEIIALYSANRLDEAYSQITKITEKDRDFELWYLLANISQDKGSNSNAVFFLQKSIKLNPEFDKAHYNLGNIYLEEKRYNLAINEYKQAIKIKKDFAYYYYNMGCAYIGLKDYKYAKNAIEKAIKLKSDEADFYYNLAFANRNLNNEKEMKTALESYNRLKDKNI